MAARELFVWYRVRRERAATAHAGVAAMQQELVEQWPGLRARLLVRDEGEAATWMEAYSRASSCDGIDATIEAAIVAAAQPLDALVDGARHVEAFTAVEG